MGERQEKKPARIRCRQYVEFRLSRGVGCLSVNSIPIVCRNGSERLFLVETGVCRLPVSPLHLLSLG